VREADHSPPSSAEVKECVELYLHPNTPSGHGAHLKNSTGTTLLVRWSGRLRIRGTIPPPLQYVFMASCFIKLRDTFACTFLRDRPITEDSATQKNADLRDSNTGSQRSSCVRSSPGDVINTLGLVMRYAPNHNRHFIHRDTKRVHCDR
jgi:hypothetical protein